MNDVAGSGSAYRFLEIREKDACSLHCTHAGRTAISNARKGQRASILFLAKAAEHRRGAPRRHFGLRNGEYSEPRARPSAVARRAARSPLRRRGSRCRISGPRTFLSALPTCAHAERSAHASTRSGEERTHRTSIRLEVHMTIVACGLPLLHKRLRARLPATGFAELTVHI